MELIQHLFEEFLQVAEKVLDLLDGEMDYPSFQLELKKELDNTGKMICREVLEGADAWLKANPKERKNWIVERKDEVKSVVTTFGEMTFKRTYYHNKKTGGYAHLIDLAAGLQPHAKTDLAVRANLVDSATDVSYRKAGKQVCLSSPECDLSGQTVMNMVRRTSLDNHTSCSRGPKAQARVLHVQADEDHVHRQEGGTALAKLVYTTEGYGPSLGKRKCLSNVRYTAGLYKDNEALCQDVYDGIDSDYDIDSIEKLFVSGDGALWIKGLADYLGAVFLLDRYHINKCINESLAFCPELRRELRQAVEGFDLDAAKSVLKKARKKAATETEKERVARCRKYLVGNWDGIYAWKTEAPDVIGCSAEGHVSHVLSARLSSRPMAWSEPGADRISKLRAMKANGISVRDYVLQQAAPDLTLTKAVRYDIPSQREQLRKVSGEVFDNMPALRGSTASLRRALRAISTTSTI